MPPPPPPPWHPSQTRQTHSLSCFFRSVSVGVNMADYCGRSASSRQPASCRYQSTRRSRLFGGRTSVSQTESGFRKTADLALNEENFRSAVPERLPIESAAVSVVDNFSSGA